MMLNFKYLSGFTVVVTGACGFIGQELIKSLLESKAAVIAIDKCNTGDRISFFANHQTSCRFLHGDFNEVADQIKNHLNPDKNRNILIHLAGLSHAGQCQNEPLLAFDINVHLTVKVLDFCRNNGIKKFIFPSTALVYGDRKNYPLTENEEVFPSNIYTATKLSAEAMIKGYSASYGLRAIIARLSNVYGKFGNNDTVFQVILKQINNKEKKLIIQDGSPIRDFIHVDDVIKALKLLIAYSGEHNYEVFNVSTGIGTQIIKLAQTACEVTGMHKNIEIISRNNSLEAKSILIVDNNALKTKTGWLPDFTIKSGLLKILRKEK